MSWNWLSRIGTLTRHPIDRYPDRAGWAYGLFQPVVPPGPDPFVELYNNDQGGRSLRIYAMFTGQIFGGVSYLVVRPGPVGTPFTQAAKDFQFISPLVAGQVQPPGLMLRGTVPEVPQNFANLQPFIVSSNQFLPMFIPGAPIAIVPPGFSAIGLGWSAQASCETSFLYMWD